VHDFDAVSDDVTADERIPHALTSHGLTVADDWLVRYKGHGTIGK